MSKLLKLVKVDYSQINAKQKEVYNFQKFSGLFADYGFTTMKLSDDWNNCDFLAIHFDGATILRVQQKGRMTFKKDYLGKKLWICFRSEERVYLYPHDELLKIVLRKTNIANTDSWLKLHGGYSFPSIPESLRNELNVYLLGTIQLKND